MFPAYSGTGEAGDAGSISALVLAPLPTLSPPPAAAVAAATSALALVQQGRGSMSPGRECALLASDSDEEELPLAAPARVAAPPRVPAPTDCATEDYYVDRKLDRGNLPVTTLYYPGRPDYYARSYRAALGLGALGWRSPRPQRAVGSRAGRYHAQPYALAHTPDSAEADLRARAFRKALADQPDNEELWLQYIDFQEWCGSASDALEAAQEACKSVGPARGGGAAIRGRLHAALRRALPPHELAERLRDMLAAEKCGWGRVELWQRLVTALGAAPHGAGEAGVRRAAAAALADVGHEPHALPALLLVYGSFLRSAGLWEQLVQLVELVVAMNFPPSDVFPPPRDRDAEESAEDQLREYEDKVIRSGLPLGTVWARVERARREVHWRPLRGGAREQADPQRAPLPSDAAELLVPARGPHVLVALLRLAEVPLLPSAECVARAVDARAADLCAGWEAGGGGALLALLRAARRLPAALPALPAAAASLLSLTPLRAYSCGRRDTTGFGKWVETLWEAALQWSAGTLREALLCWRLRVMHAHLLLQDEESAEARRVCSAAREALRRHAGDSALPYAQYARLEHAAGGRGHGRGRALNTALRALRAALRSDAAAAHDALYIARVVCEVSGWEEGRCEVGLWALCGAALRRPALLDRAAPGAPAPALVAEALRVCTERCEELEAQLRAGRGRGRGHGREQDALEGGAASMLPAAAEWSVARVMLSTPAQRHLLLAQLLHAGSAHAEGVAHGEWGRWREQTACALVGAAARDHRAAHTARALAHMFPHNGYLAMMCSAAPLWAWEPAVCASAGARLRALCAPRSDLSALAGALPALLAAAAAQWAPREAGAAARACRRALRGGGGGGAAGSAALRVLLLEGEARGGTPAAAERALYTALDAAPHAQWAYIQGAALCAGAAAELPDLLLERQLRLHALPDELPPPPPPAPHHRSPSPHRLVIVKHDEPE